jgi:hypothetical protein
MIAFHLEIVIIVGVPALVLEVAWLLVQIMELGV